MSLAAACEIVCLTANLEQFKTTPKSQRRLEDLVLSSRVRARIASDERIADGEIEIEANGGVITIKGTAQSSVEADKIREVVLQTTGVKEINSQMRVWLR